MRVAQEEIFGPVARRHPVRRRGRRACGIANDCIYGLRRLDLDARHRAGAADGRAGAQPARSRSTTNHSIHVEAPFGGYKQSGIGRELGMYGLELYTEVKNVYVELYGYLNPRPLPLRGEGDRRGIATVARRKTHGI